MKAVKESLMKAMKAYFQNDAGRINHACRVTEYAEELLRREGGEYPVVVGAAVVGVGGGVWIGGEMKK